MTSLIKVLVVDDSALIRQILTRALSFDPRLEVVGTARTGIEAIEKARLLAPDVITLDIEMPELTGLEALPFLMRDTQSRVIMLSSVDDPTTTYEALEGGAVDFIAKPKGGFATSITDLADLLLKKIKIAYRIPPEKRGSVGPPLARELAGEGRSAPGPPAVAAIERAEVASVVAIAASTGGPPALERVFSGLRADLPAAYVVVQHLPSGFTASLVERLRKVTDIRICEGEQSLILEPGCAYIAPHGRHMSVVAGRSTLARIQLHDGPSVHGVRPAADPLVSSVAESFGARSVGVLLTGMGQDGAEGLELVVARGGTTIVQDEATSVVWGMPGAAVRRGVAQRVVPIDGVAAEIRRAVRGGG